MYLIAQDQLAQRKAGSWIQPTLKRVGKPLSPTILIKSVATLRYKGTFREHWVYTWDDIEVSHFKPKITSGVSDHMTFWESLAFLMCCVTWQSCIKAHPIMIV